MKKIIITALFVATLMTGANAQIVGATDYTQPTSTGGEVYVPSSVSLGFNAYFGYSGGLGYAFFRNVGASKEFMVQRWPFAFSTYLDYFGDKSVKVNSHGNYYQDSYGWSIGVAYLNRGGHGNNGFDLKLSNLSVRLAVVDRYGKNNSEKWRFGIGADLPLMATMTVPDFSYQKENITTWFTTVSPSFFIESHHEVGVVCWGMHTEMYVSITKNGIVENGDTSFDSSVPVKGMFLVGFLTGVYIGWESKPMLTSR